MTPAIARASAQTLWAQKPLLASKQIAPTKSLEDLALQAPTDAPPAPDSHRGQIVDIVA